MTQPFSNKEMGGRECFVPEHGGLLIKSLNSVFSPELAVVTEFLPFSSFLPFFDLINCFQSIKGNKKTMKKEVREEESKWHV